MSDAGPFLSYSTFQLNQTTYCYTRLAALEEQGLTTLAELPYSIRVLLESVLRNCDGFEVTEADVKNLAAWSPNGNETSIPFKPARVILQDFTGVPAVVDLAAMRDAMQRIGGDPKKINPLIPVDLIIDHSIQTDDFGHPGAMARNVELEFKRNGERYALLHWAQKAFDNFRVIPPSVGIIHQVNLEYLADVVMTRIVGRSTDGLQTPGFGHEERLQASDFRLQEEASNTNPEAGSLKPEVRPEVRSPKPEAQTIVFPDTVVGTDSHTVMINGLGVLGWGVGGIEAEAVMLGQSYSMLVPQVIGVKLTGKLPAGTTATDLVLTVTEMLRREGVVGKFVEFFGDGAADMPVVDRAVLANMAPEYGATMGFFPIDDNTIAFLRETGRDEEQVQLVETYSKKQRLFRNADSPTPKYTKVLELNLATIEPSLAGPKRPQDRVLLREMSDKWREAQSAERRAQSAKIENHFALCALRSALPAPRPSPLIPYGAVVIASITSCTNTSNPNLMIAAGLLAQKAVARGLQSKPWVKTSLAPGSRVVTDYLHAAGLDTALDALGFHTVGYGCLTCIGNSGPLPEPVADAITKNDLTVAAVLSGNRNFEGRVNPLVKANYLASPPLVVAYALAGTVALDLTTQPLGTGSDGEPVYLRDIWPTDDEIATAAKLAIDPSLYKSRYANVDAVCPEWNAIPTQTSELFPWDADSTYIQKPPFLADLTLETKPPVAIRNARCLVALGDSVTTDHISPAGSIKPDSPAGCYLRERGVAQADFNSYGSRRGNDRVMTRGTFANIRIRNLLVTGCCAGGTGTEGGVTRYFGPRTSGFRLQEEVSKSNPEARSPKPEVPDVMPIYDAAVKYQAAGVPLIVLAGAEYGTGSSRDWAAKGTMLLGIRAVIASSFERIHRGNLVGMGVLPLQLHDGVTWQSLGLTGEEIFDLPPIADDFVPGGEMIVTARRFQASVFTDREMVSNTNPEARSPKPEVLTFPVKVRIDTPVELTYYLNGGIMPTVIRRLAQYTAERQ